MKGPMFLACNPSSIEVHLFKHSYFIPAFKSSGAYVPLYESNIESLIFQSGQPNHYLSKIRELCGKDRTVETAQEVGGVTVCFEKFNIHFRPQSQRANAELRSGLTGTKHFVVPTMCNFKKLG